MRETFSAFELPSSSCIPDLTEVTVTAGGVELSLLHEVKAKILKRRKTRNGAFIVKLFWSITILFFGVKIKSLAQINAPGSLKKI